MGKVGLAAACALAAVACVAAAVVVGRRARRLNSCWRAVEEFEIACATPTWRLKQVVDAVAVEMHAGLASEGGSKLKMLLTYVYSLPTGSEKGTYYALDLGGTNLRLLRVELDGQRSAVIRHTVERKRIPEHVKTSSTEELFDFVASSLKEFVDREARFSEEGRKELGFTFSFPVKQISECSGTLIKWTKGFSIDDTVGRDVSQCLEEAIARKGLNVRVTALINDAVGTLALGHYNDEDTVIAVTIGTGTNACYLERVDSIIKCQGPLTSSADMVVNIEWGNFWSSHLPRTSYDADLDADSPNPNDQGFEKMISGMYLGEIVRRVILRMAQESGVLKPISSNLSMPFALKTPAIAAMHEDQSSDLNEVARILQETLEIDNVPLYVRKLVVKICDTVTIRAARLVAAAIVGILKKMGRDRNENKKRTVIAVEGGLYSNYAMFREYLGEALGQILGDDVASYVVISLAEDGSGFGAALLAASQSTAAAED